MKIKDLLQDLPKDVSAKEILEKDIVDITCQSSDVRPGTLFVAIQGEDQDGHRFIPDAFKKGAVACVMDKKSGLRFSDSLPLLRVEDTRWVFSLFASRFFEHPSRDVTVIGTTGTNGKTTTSFLIQHVFNYFSSCGLIGTIHHQIGNQIIPSKNTTPSAYDLNWMLTQMKKMGVRFCSMEVSSHALRQERVTHLSFRSAIFTNLTQDHLDYHKTLEQYFDAKRRLFVKTPRPTRIFVNIDDLCGQRLFDSLSPLPVTFGMRKAADFLAHHIQVSLGSIRFDLSIGRRTISVKVNLPCLHNVYNVLAAFACACEEGWDPVEISEVLQTFPGVPGRMERIDRGQDFLVFVDYAHTPAAFQNVLGSVRGVARKRIITVFGCGGDRDPTKRPVMGRIASLFSDTVILTSDNPRSEHPEAILDQIEEGLIKISGRSFFRISNREEAIAQALSLAEPGDVVLILGKGHENYQVIGDKRFQFDDRVCAEKILSEISHAHAV